MTLEIIRDMLGWCIVMNWIVLAWWLLFFIIAHDWMYRIHTKWFKIAHRGLTHSCRISGSARIMDTMIKERNPNLSYQLRNFRLGG